MNKCTLCPNNCNIDRNTKTGVCLVNNNIKIAKAEKFMYEEPCISGTNGSGAVFFVGCSLGCVFCQNFELSRNKRGKEITVNELVDIFKQLEEEGVHNINLVNPTHYSHKIAEALSIYRPNIPICYNSHGYEEVSVLKEMDKFIDIYLPDMKYFSPIASKRYSNKANYFEKASKALEFMSNKPLIFDGDIMKSGTVVRHLILPQNTADSLAIVDFLATFKDKVYISLMSQYTPFGDISTFKELQRKITKREYNSVLNRVIEHNLKNVYIQDISSSSEEYIPMWDY